MLLVWRVPILLADRVSVYGVLSDSVDVSYMLPFSLTEPARHMPALHAADALGRRAESAVLSLVFTVLQGSPACLSAVSCTCIPVCVLSVRDLST